MTNKQKCLLTAVCAVLLAGCSTTPELTESQKQDQILSNPWGYKPSVQGMTDDDSMTHFDQAGFSHDLNDFFGP